MAPPYIPNRLRRTAGRIVLQGLRCLGGVLSAAANSTCRQCRRYGRRTAAGSLIGLLYSLFQRSHLPLLQKPTQKYDQTARKRASEGDGLPELGSTLYGTNAPKQFRCQPLFPAIAENFSSVGSAGSLALGSVRHVAPGADSRVLLRAQVRRFACRPFWIYYFPLLLRVATQTIKSPKLISSHFSITTSQRSKNFPVGRILHKDQAPT